MSSRNSCLDKSLKPGYVGVRGPFASKHFSIFYGIFELKSTDQQPNIKIDFEINKYKYNSQQKSYWFHISIQIWNVICLQCPTNLHNENHPLRYNNTYGIHARRMTRCPQIPEQKLITERWLKEYGQEDDDNASTGPVSLNCAFINSQRTSRLRASSVWLRHSKRQQQGRCMTRWPVKNVSTSSLCLGPWISGRKTSSADISHTTSSKRALVDAVSNCLSRSFSFSDRTSNLLNFFMSNGQLSVHIPDTLMRS